MPSSSPAVYYNGPVSIQLHQLAFFFARLKSWAKGPHQKHHLSGLNFISSTSSPMPPLPLLLSPLPSPGGPSEQPQAAGAVRGVVRAQPAQQLAELAQQRGGRGPGAASADAARPQAAPAARQLVQPLLAEQRVQVAVQQRQPALEPLALGPALVKREFYVVC
eukprot:CAMPEP_0194723118 /NCGR_PEP_ID=MMETSP0296-20130528/14172_1 /TAXON_ID=39354 /ORGANISM="Heterosigma akashiwo, Strain CCMP2393" /LENGTH=162 /DNA_ID=CAMNT_0039626407 /DNA_START=427 /DNA_END=915 /DNA_ORIENTATION=+